MSEQMSLIEAPAGPLRAISLTQPWASLVAIGAKRYETRSWSTQYRGPLAIAAAKGFPRACKDLCYYEPFFGVLRDHDVHWPDIVAARGHVVAVVDLVGCISTRGLPLHIKGYPEPGKHEQTFGDYSPGRYAWALDNLRRLERPVPAKGALGVWTVPADVERAIKEQLP